MFNWLMPKEISFFDYFERHAAVTIAAAKELVELVNNPIDIHLSAARVKDLEHQGDNETHQCVEALHKTFITPLEREDIFKLISRMDDVLDCIDDAVRCISLYKITHMPQFAPQLADLVLKSTKEVEKAVKSLKNLKNSNEIKAFCLTINHIENESDLVLAKAVVDLFENEKDVKLLIKWKEIYEKMEEAVDDCEDVANIIDGIILEYL